MSNGLRDGALCRVPWMARTGTGGRRRTATSPNVEAAPPKRTRGGHQPTGTSANRRAKAAAGATPKGERTRAEIVRAGRVVFERMGYIDARVSDIAREAGVAHGSFYTYFPSKREVFQEVLMEMGARVREAVAHGPEDVAGDTLKNLERANRRYLEVHHEHARLMVLYEQVATIDPVIERFRVDARRRHVDRVTKTIRRLQDRGLADPEVDPAPTAAALVAMLSSYAYWSTVKGMKADVPKTARTVTAIWSRAIGLRRETPAP
jgi:AcrR family transcriptional regulator